MPFNCPSSKLFCRPERSVQVSFFDNFPPLLAFAFLQKWLAWPYPILKENQRQTPSYHFNEAPPETKIPIKCVRKGFIPPLGILESSEMLPFCTDPGSFRSTSTKEPPCLLLSLHLTASFQHWGVSNPESLCFSPRAGLSPVNPHLYVMQEELHLQNIKPGCWKALLVIRLSAPDTGTYVENTWIAPAPKIWNHSTWHPLFSPYSVSCTTTGFPHMRKQQKA